MKRKTIQVVSLCVIGGLAFCILAVLIVPTVSWRYGTPKMQSRVIQAMSGKIEKGMTYDQVKAILGPGSAGWPDGFEKELDQSQVTKSFNIRAGWNVGVDVTFLSNRVIYASPYN